MWRRIILYRFQIDRFVRVPLFVALAVSAAVVLLVVCFLVLESADALRAIGPWRFVSDASWHPTRFADTGQFNLMPIVWGTLWVTVGAVLVAAPLAFLMALYLYFFAAPRRARAVRSLLGLLAGIPSVVYGLWGLTVLVPWISRWQPPGASLLAGILILALMILPTIALLTDAAFQATPKASADAAAAAGLSRWGALRAVVWPPARSGVVAALVLGTGRALGETMAVLMVCGNVVRTPSSLFDPIRTLTANIALEMAYAMDLHRSALFVTGLMLAVAVGVMVLLASLLKERDPYAA